MKQLRSILTHPGGAHKDEFLACSVLLALAPVPIERREPNAADLADPETCVVDVGHRHEPALNNFDHHQFPKDQVPTCSLSLVLQHLGLYEDARLFCEWLEPAEWFDCRGPVATAAWLGVDRDLLARLNSPIDIALLQQFSLAARLEPREPLWEIMRSIGDGLLGYVRSLRARLDFLSQHAEVWSLPASANDETKIIFVPRTEPLPDEPSQGLDRFAEQLGIAESVVGLVYPDRRGSGYGLSRFRDHPRLDFTRVASDPSVHFAHARGFVAKTSASDREQIKRLLLRAADASIRPGA